VWGGEEGGGGVGGVGLGADVGGGRKEGSRSHKDCAH